MQTSTSSNITLADGVVHTFFARDPAPFEEPPYRPERDLNATVGQQRLQLGQRDVGRRPVSIQDQLGMRFDLT